MPGAHHEILKIYRPRASIAASNSSPGSTTNGRGRETRHARIGLPSGGKSETHDTCLIPGERTKLVITAQTRTMRRAVGPCSRKPPTNGWCAVPDAQTGMRRIRTRNRRATLGNAPDAGKRHCWLPSNAAFLVCSAYALSVAMGALGTVFCRPDEVVALVRYKHKSRKAASEQERALKLRASESQQAADWRFCYDYLQRVSRSFALVIMELDSRLRDPACIFYLVLRALDTIEDDTSVDATLRMRLCRELYTHLGDPTYKLHDIGQADERTLLEQLPKVFICFRELDSEYQEIIADITRRMGDGMAQHIHQKECETVADYDLYCHYVAGLVGIGLSAMFAASGHESREVFVESKLADTLANSMGLFLQKTNIIRDYLEDQVDGRTFWPREIWSRFGKGLTLGDLAQLENRRAALECLNAMITDALRHVPDCLLYMSQVQTESVFYFVAIPQVMAIATLALCYNNPDVFERRVKLRRGQTAKLVLRTRDMSAVLAIFTERCEAIASAADPCDPSYAETVAAVEHALSVATQIGESLAFRPMGGQRAPAYRPPLDLKVANRIAVILFIVLSLYVLYRRKQQDGGGLGWRAAFGGIPSLGDLAAIALLFAVLSYLLGVFGLQYVCLAPPNEEKPPQSEVN
jgi:farnesyl-diphosphate farnesyltransferase